MAAKISMHLLAWLAAVATSAMSDVAAPSCDTWNSQEFFSQATVQDVEECVRGGADVEAEDENGWAPLRVAAFFSDNPDVITRLLEHGADPEARDRDGATPLHLAAANNANPSVIAHFGRGRCLRERQGRGWMDTAALGSLLQPEPQRDHQAGRAGCRRRGREQVTESRHGAWSCTTGRSPGPGHGGCSMKPVSNDSRV